MIYKIINAILIRGGGAALGVALLLLLTRQLGPNQFGLYSQVIAITSVVAVFSKLGLDTLLLKKIAGSWRSPGGTSAAVGMVEMAVWNTLGVSVLISMATYWMLLSLWPAAGTLKVPLSIAMAFVWLQGIKLILSESTKAIGEVGRALFINNIVPVTIMLCAVYVTKADDAETVLWIYNVASGLCVLLFLFRWRLQGVARNRIAIVSTVADAFPFFQISLLNVVFASADILIAGFLFGAHDVGLYASANRLAAVSALILGTVNSVLAPRFARLCKERRISELSVLYHRCIIGMSVVAFSIVALYLYIGTKSELVIGEDFADAGQLLAVIAIGQFFVLATGPVAYLLMMSGHEKYHRRSIIIGMIIGVGGSLVLSNWFGIMGVAIATAAALTTKNIISTVYVHQYVFKKEND